MPRDFLQYFSCFLKHYFPVQLKNTLVIGKKKRANQSTKKYNHKIIKTKKYQKCITHKKANQKCDKE